MGGLMGVTTAFLMETWITVWAYPLNIAGRPLFSWPAFIIPAYEWTILFSGLAAAFGMMALNGMPQLYHPVFNAPNFRNGATTDKFFLCLEAADPKFAITETRAFLEQFAPVSVVEVEHVISRQQPIGRQPEEPVPDRCRIGGAGCDPCASRMPAGHARPAQVHSHSVARTSSPTDAPRARR